MVAIFKEHPHHVIMENYLAYDHSLDKALLREDMAPAGSCISCIQHWIIWNPTGAFSPRFIRAASSFYGLFQSSSFLLTLLVLLWQNTGTFLISFYTYWGLRTLTYLWLSHTSSSLSRLLSRSQAYIFFIWFSPKPIWVSFSPPGTCHMEVTLQFPKLSVLLELHWCWEMFCFPMSNGKEVPLPSSLTVIPIFKDVWVPILNFKSRPWSLTHWTPGTGEANDRSCSWRPTPLLNLFSLRSFFCSVGLYIKHITLATFPFLLTFCAILAVKCQFPPSSLSYLFVIRSSNDLFKKQLWSCHHSCLKYSNVFSILRENKIYINYRYVIHIQHGLASEAISIMLAILPPHWSNFDFLEILCSLPHACTCLFAYPPFHTQLLFLVSISV